MPEAIVIDSDSDDARSPPHLPNRSPLAVRSRTRTRARSLSRPLLLSGHAHTQSSSQQSVIQITPSSSQSHVTRGSSPDISFPSFAEMLRRRSPRISARSHPQLDELDDSDVPPSRPSTDTPSIRTGTLRRTSSVPSQTKASAPPRLIVIGSDSIHASSDRASDAEMPSSPILTQSQPLPLPLLPAHRPLPPSAFDDPIVLSSSPDPHFHRDPDRTFHIASSSPPSSPPRPRQGTLRKTSSLLDALDALTRVDADQARSGPSTKRPRPASSSPEKRARPSSSRSEADLESNHTSRPSISNTSATEKQSKKQQEREAKRAERQRAIAERKRWIEANRLRRSKSDTMGEMIIQVDSRLVDPGAALHAALEPLRTRFTEDGAEFRSVRGESWPPLIRFERKVKARLDTARRAWIPLDHECIESERVVLVCLDGAELVRLVEQDRLLSSMHQLRTQHERGTQIFLLVVGLQRFFARRRAEVNRAYSARIRSQLTGGGPKPAASTAPVHAITADDADTQLIRLRVLERVFVTHANGLVDLVEWIAALTADISLRPYKLMRSSHLSFCAEGRAPSSTAEREIYRLMLQQIPRVTPHVSDAIIAAYPSLHSLFSAYDRCATQHEKDNLLAECNVALNVNGTVRAAGRRAIGPQLSRRIAAVLTGDDPLTLVGGQI